MIRILLKGYYGFQNTGDDALFAASVWGARQAFGTGVAIVAVGSTIPVFPGSGLVRAAYPAACRWRGEARMRLWLEALRSRAILFGGGSVFHSGARLQQVGSILRLAGRGPHLAAGVSIGPFLSVADERACAKVLRRLAFLGLRDQESAELAQILAPRVASRLTFDLAPLLLSMAEDAPGAPHARHGLGVALCDYERFTNGDVRREELRRTRVSSVLRGLDRELVDEIVLVDFNGHPEKGDSRIHADIRSLIERSGVPVRQIPYDARPLQVLRTVGKLRAMIGMRLHAAVFGYLAQTPTVVLSYHPKCRGWAAQAGVPPSMVFDSVDFDPAEVADAVRRALRGHAPTPALPVATAVEHARLNFPQMEL